MFKLKIIKLPKEIGIWENVRFRGATDVEIDDYSYIYQIRNYDSSTGAYQIWRGNKIISKSATNVAIQSNIDTGVWVIYKEN